MGAWRRRGGLQGVWPGCGNPSPACYLPGLAWTCWDLPCGEVTLLAPAASTEEAGFLFLLGMLPLGWERGRAVGWPRGRSVALPAPLAWGGGAIRRDRLWAGILRVRLNAPSLGANWVSCGPVLGVPDWVGDEKTTLCVGVLFPRI